MTSREEVSRRVAAEQRLNGRLRVALDKHGFIACLGWSGKECIEKTVWDALITSEQRVEELEEALRWYQARNWAALLKDEVFAGMLRSGHRMSDRAEAALSAKERP